ncbi:MAG: lipoyl(octanoyl) transferase LipB [Mariprofundaceae bacterium]
MRSASMPVFQWLGHQPYKPMRMLLQEYAARVAKGEADEVVWACEHEQIYTTGRRAIDNRLEDVLPAPLMVTDRGGETTYHGPGQIMLYPIAHLRARGLGVKQYVHLLEQSCIELLEELGIEARRRCGYPGVWLGESKVAAVGVRVARGVVYHGMAMNVKVDPACFAAIRPCGLNFPVANLSDVGVAMPLPELAEGWYHCFADLLAAVKGV